MMQKKNQSYRDLEMWKKARLLVKAVYVAGAAFPQEEIYGLTFHIRRLASSAEIGRMLNGLRRSLEERLKQTELRTPNPELTHA